MTARAFHRRARVNAFAFVGTVRATALGVCAVALCGVSGCATVKPWDRELLADPAMSFGGGEQARDHALSYREGSGGARGASAGGCGCN